MCGVVLLTTCSCSLSKNALTVLDAEGSVFATVGSHKALEKNENRAYLEIVLDEAVEIITGLEGIEESQAKDRLYNGGYSIYTAFDGTLNQKLATGCSPAAELTEVAAVVTNLQGEICGAYSNGNDQNLATKVNLPCSALKPLSVYAPALDSGTINWSSQYKDSAYTMQENSEGVKYPWPANANGSYSDQNIYISQAISESTNTVAVKCLADYGVQNSINFLEENFSIPLSTEKALAETEGTSSILGNLALGALIDGVSAVDMAGYYQIFANGGKYQAPKAITKICDKEGKVIYEITYTPKQVVKTSTADIMNHLLTGVVSPGGTGSAARCEEVSIAGKTGTDDDFLNNWFVGVTPEYSFAFWHGASNRNMAAEICGTAITQIYGAKTDYVKDFKYTSGIRKIAYCTDSGKQYKIGCPLLDMGYYEPGDLPPICDKH